MAKKEENFSYNAIAFSNDILFDDDGEIRGAKVGKVAHIFIWGSIGGWWGANGVDLFRQLAGESPEEIRVYISSGGGGVVAAFEIYNLLKGHNARVVTYIFSLAASAATIVSAAGDDGFRIMAPTSVKMIHEGRPGLYGFYSEDELASALLQTRTFNDRIASVYSSLTGKPIEHSKAEMKREVWMTPEVAISEGYVDRSELMEIPFHLAKITEQEFYHDYEEHTAQYATGLFADIGFVASSKLSNVNQRAMNLVQKFYAFVANTLGAKMTDKDGNELTADSLEKALTGETKNEFDNLFTAGSTEQMSNVFAQVIDAKVGDLKKGFEAQLKKQEDDFKAQTDKLKGEIAAMKNPGASGQQANSDQGTQANNGGDQGNSTEEEIQARMGSETQRHAIASSGAVNMQLIREIAAEAVKKSKELEAAK